MNNQPILKAQSPAALAEEYIVRSIWNNYFPPGSDLPAERELAEKIGVTRTTLREVLQRLARDGWLSIQHGKPTRVNDIWETSGVNIIESIVKLDETRVPSLIANILSARTNIATIYIPKAFKVAKQESLALFENLPNLTDSAETFVSFDYDIFRKLAFAADNPIYGLVLNSFRSLYMRVGVVYFSSIEAKKLALAFYQNLKSLCETQQLQEVIPTIRQYGKDSGVIWAAMQQNILEDLAS
ncbi:fatty acid metabolism transcriptional regulator FadR [Conservatibacter flavescens]|uniref:Fatty acid metabolism regulator protein n=1 Tax=Conservatibacter flavescens TaxID=28161 RepID=A0A2M8S3S9_9PAST|nr:fatty acid metabolism transcriptional regulator FadR [Conservatibacter flavescens]PJG85780.1 fatty acid metabolism transcriptional regulator FadR [Conservatibacter flavescens]